MRLDGSLKAGLKAGLWMRLSLLCFCFFSSEKLKSKKVERNSKK
jgi:hypothetical protein